MCTREHRLLGREIIIQRFVGQLKNNSVVSFILPVSLIIGRRSVTTKDWKHVAESVISTGTSSSRSAVVNREFPASSRRSLGDRRPRVVGRPVDRPRGNRRV